MMDPDLYFPTSSGPEERRQIPSGRRSEPVSVEVLAGGCCLYRLRPDALHHRLQAERTHASKTAAADKDWLGLK
jgi:hypothetical protein